LNPDGFFRSAFQNPESISKRSNQPVNSLTTSPYEFSSASRRAALLRKTPAPTATAFLTVRKNVTKDPEVFRSLAPKLSRIRGLYGHQG
jgi:hypothetical protein